MPNGRGRHKSRNKARSKKTSKGKNGQRKYPLDGTTKVLMGKGQHRTMTHVPCSTWLGTSTVHAPFNKEQAELNKKLYPHLFASEQV